MHWTCETAPEAHPLPLLMGCVHVVDDAQLISLPVIVCDDALDPPVPLIWPEAPAGWDVVPVSVLQVSRAAHKLQSVA